MRKGRQGDPEIHLSHLLPVCGTRVRTAADFVLERCQEQAAACSQVCGAARSVVQQGWAGPREARWAAPSSVFPLSTPLPVSGWGTFSIATILKLTALRHSR